jgi:nicotinamide riboside transporter PnuC
MSSVARGRCLVLTTIIITLLGNLVLAVLPAVGDSIPFFAGTILGFCAVAALLYAMWRGQNWARWLLVAIYVVGLALRLTLIFARRMDWILRGPLSSLSQLFCWRHRPA